MVPNFNDMLPFPNCQHLGKENELDLYAMTQTTHNNDQNNKIRILHIGQRNILPIKTILLHGETGAGKTTFVNSVYNHFYGVRFEDNYRMKIVESREDAGLDKKVYESQTEGITGYLFYAQPSMPYAHYNLMVIDTPGFNDTRGVHRQNEIIEQIKVFLKNEQYGVVDLHCLAFVVKADFNRSLPYFQNIINQCLELFGKDTMSITNILKTHAVDRNNNVKEIFENWGLHIENEFSFDNGLLYEPNKAGIKDKRNHTSTDDEVQMKAFRWNIQSRKTDNFLQTLFRLPSVSLRLTRQSLKEKAYLEQTKENLSDRLQEAFTHCIANKAQIRMLFEYEKCMIENIEWQGKEVRLQKRRVSMGGKSRWYQKAAHVHNCLNCEKTCSAICHSWIPCPKEDSKCIVCNCPASAHTRSNERIEVTLIVNIITDADMKAKFENAEYSRNKTQNMINNINKEQNALKGTIATMIKHIGLHTERLNEMCRLFTCKTSEEITREITEGILVNDVTLRNNIGEEYNDFLKSIFDEVDRIDVDKDSWVRELKEIVKSTDSAWDKIMKSFKQVSYVGLDVVDSMTVTESYVLYIEENYFT